MAASHALDASLADLERQLHQHVNIAVVGQVSSGKSSLINALLGRERDDAVAEVGAESGVTTELKLVRLDDWVLIVDSPGLDDIRAENSKVTREFLEHIDVGIFVVTGSADATQRRLYDELRRVCEATFVVLNKVDEWDRYNPEALEKVVRQWCEALDVERIHTTATWGYDPELDDTAPLDLRGVDELRVDLEAALQDKVLRLARHMRRRLPYAAEIVSSAMTVTSRLPVLRASPAASVVAQVRAICAMHFLYTGSTLGRASALALLPVVARNAPLTWLALWLPPLMPLWLVLRSLAARLRAALTFGLLAAVQGALAEGEPLQRDTLGPRFRVGRHLARRRLAAADPADWKTPEFWRAILDAMGGREPGKSKGF